MCEISEKIQKRGEKIGEKRGRKIGEEKKAHSTALNLFHMGLSPEQIAGAVGESLELVKNWISGAEQEELKKGNC